MEIRRRRAEIGAVTGAEIGAVTGAETGAVTGAETGAVTDAETGAVTGAEESQLMMYGMSALSNQYHATLRTRIQMQRSWVR